MSTKHSYTSEFEHMPLSIRTLRHPQFHSINHAVQNHVSLQICARRGAQISGTSSPWRLHLLRWRLIFVTSQSGSWIFILMWNLDNCHRLETHLQLFEITSYQLRHFITYWNGAACAHHNNPVFTSFMYWLERHFAHFHWHNRLLCQLWHISSLLETHL